MKLLQTAILCGALALPFSSVPTRAMNDAPPKNASSENATAESAPHSHGHSHEKPRATTGNPQTRADVLWQEADAAFHKGDYETAIVHYRELVKIEPDNIDAYSNSAWLTWSLGRGDEAAKLMRNATQRNPRLSAAWYAAGEHFDLQKREPKTAYAFYERALSLKPKGHARWQTLHRLAFAAEKTGNVTRAIQVWTRTLAEYPTDAIARRKLTQLRAKTATDAAATKAVRNVGKAVDNTSSTR